jgi:hypothetical protein
MGNSSQGTRIVSKTTQQLHWLVCVMIVLLMSVDTITFVLCTHEESHININSSSHLFGSHLQHTSTHRQLSWLQIKVTLNNNSMAVLQPILLTLKLLPCFVKEQQPSNRLSLSNSQKPNSDLYQSISCHNTTLMRWCYVGWGTSRHLRQQDQQRGHHLLLHQRR